MKFEKGLIMKIKSILIISLLLAVLTIGAASAADNVTLESAAAEDGAVESAGDSLELSDSSGDALEGKDINLTVEHERVMSENDKVWVEIEPHDARGPVSVLVDGSQVFHDDHFWFGHIPIDPAYGNHTLEVRYLGCGGYSPVTYTAPITYSYAKVRAYDDGEVIVDSKWEMPAKLYIDGVLVYDGIINEYTQIYADNLYRGYVPNYTLITEGRGKYPAMTIRAPLIYDVSPQIDVAEYIAEGEDRFLTVTMPPDADGNLQVFINDINVNVSFEKGKAAIALNDLAMGEYRINVTYDSDSKYEDYTESFRHFTVTYNPNITLRFPDICYAMGSAITFTGSEEVEGKITVFGDYSDEDFEGDYRNGTAVVNIYSGEEGLRTYHYSFTGKYKGEEFRYDGEFNITMVGFTVTVPEAVYEKKSFKVTFTGPSDLKGDLDCPDSESGIVKVKNGQATITIGALDAGVNTIYYDFSNDHVMFYSSFEVEVLKKGTVVPQTINAADFKTSYSSKSKYTVQILENRSKPAAGKKVTFILYGLNDKSYKYNKKVAEKTAETDGNGYVGVSFKVAPGNYRIKIKYANASTVTKKYKVKSIIKPTYVYKKHGRIKLTYKKKFEFGATLKKVDGKVLKGKKVKITFYRQDYKGKINDPYFGRLSVLKSVTVKTNSRGVVKISYKKLPFRPIQAELEGLLIEVKIEYKQDYKWVDLNVRSTSPPYYYFL